jgi:hypothetical protein
MVVGTPQLGRERWEGGVMTDCEAAYLHAVGLAILKSEEESAERWEHLTLEERLAFAEERPSSGRGSEARAAPSCNGGTPT